MKKHNLNLARNKYSEKELEDNINFFDLIDWGDIAYHQELSEEFIKKHINKISIFLLMRNKKISKKLKEKIEKEINLLKEII
jgi:hypothetical protein